MDARAPTPNPCTLCDSPAVARGLCARHDQSTADHATSSGVQIDMLDGGHVLVSVPERGTVVLSEIQWRELAAYALSWVEPDR